jgi:hypothetical protein
LVWNDGQLVVDAADADDSAIWILVQPIGYDMGHGAQRPGSPHDFLQAVEAQLCDLEAIRPVLERIQAGVGLPASRARADTNANMLAAANWLVRAFHTVLPAHLNARAFARSALHTAER